MKVTIIGGAGYVGLVTGLGLAAIGHDVISVDQDESRIEALCCGRSPIYEEGLEDLLRQCLEHGSIRFSNRLEEGVQHGEALFIAVGTPPRDDGHADLTQVIRVAEGLLHFAAGYKLVVVKSTVPVGTVELVQSILRRRKVEGEAFDIVSNPEFLREGKGLYDFFNPDRIVIGTSSEKAREMMRELYRPLIERNVSWPENRVSHTAVNPIPVVETDLAAAQMIKYAANAFLATRISYINEIAGLCERVQADVQEVARGLGFDPRIGPSYLEAGLGFGGPCLEKDLRALIKIAEETEYEPVLLRMVLERNELQLRSLLNKIKQGVGYILYKRIVTVFGLAFKAGTNEVRHSLSLRLIDDLQREGAVVHAYDPLAIPEAKALLPQIEYFTDPYQAASDADVLVIATDWPEFCDLDYTRMKSRMGHSCIVDGRNLLDGAAMRNLGFRYFGVGKP